MFKVNPGPPNEVRYIWMTLLQRKQERKVYADEDIDDDEIEGKRLFGVDEKLASNKYHHKFAKVMKGHGK